MKYLFFAFGGYVCGIIVVALTPGSAERIVEDFWSLVLTAVIAFGFGTLFAIKDKN